MTAGRAEVNPFPETGVFGVEEMEGVDRSAWGDLVEVDQYCAFCLGEMLRAGISF